MSKGSILLPSGWKGAVLLGALLLAGCRPATPGAAADDPQRQLEAFEIADGYEVNLFASEPMLANPIQMSFDPQGRLWVVNAPSFVHLEPGLPNDFISVLEDTTGDGRADKHTIFADGLNMPTGFELGDGGVYVVSQPHLLFLKDTNGDGKADLKRVLLSGFGTEDNHHAISTFRWGPGGHLYFQSGIFLHSQVETPYGVVRLQDGGVFEFSPRKLKLDVFFTSESGLPNPWGHNFDRWGQNFLNGAAGGGIYYLAPGSPRIRVTPREALPRVIAPLTSGTGLVEAGLLRRLLRADDPRVRAAATRVLRYWLDHFDDRLALLLVQVQDEHPRVRLEAVAGLSYIPSAAAAEIALRVLDTPMDRFLTYALKLTAVTLEPHWRPLVEAGRPVFHSPAHLDFALQATGPEAAEL